MLTRSKSLSESLLSPSSSPPESTASSASGDMPSDCISPTAPSARSTAATVISFEPFVIERLGDSSVRVRHIIKARLPLSQYSPPIPPSALKAEFASLVKLVTSKKRGAESGSERARLPSDSTVCCSGTMRSDLSEAQIRSRILSTASVWDEE